MLLHKPTGLNWEMGVCEHKRELPDLINMSESLADPGASFPLGALGKAFFLRFGNSVLRVKEK